MVGSQTTLTQIFLATSPKSGDRKRVRLLPEPAANSTSPLGNNAACTARTSEWNGSTCHAPTSEGLSVAILAVMVTSCAREARLASLQATETGGERPTAQVLQKPRGPRGGPGTQTGAASPAVGEHVLL